jgi:hypothetical protein
VFGEDKRPITKQQAALRQINAAISHLHVGEYECAITLAGAAEDLLGDTEPGHLWKVLMQRRPNDHSEKEWAAMFNETRNWLKHPTENLGDARHIEEFEAVIMLIRATSKFMARYNNKASKKWAILSSGVGNTITHRDKTDGICAAEGGNTASSFSFHCGAGILDV